MSPALPRTPRTNCRNISVWQIACHLPSSHINASKFNILRLDELIAPSTCGVYHPILGANNPDGRPFIPIPNHLSRDCPWRIPVLSVNIKRIKHRATQNISQVAYHRGIFAVGAAGFEPATSCSQGRRARPNCATPRIIFVNYSPAVVNVSRINRRGASFFVSRSGTVP